MNISLDDESQKTTYMDLSNEFDDHESINEAQIADRPPRNYGKTNNFRSVLELPKKFQNVFNFQFFNVIQSTTMDDVLYSDKGVVVSAPTSSGKTVVFELAILRLLMKIEDTKYSGRYKIVYVAPVKALCNERLSDWHSKFCKIGLSCIVVTGDSVIKNTSILDNYNIIITTPEKWDSLTRNIKDNNLLNDVKLFMMDEVHLLNEEARGPILEAIVCRLKILKKSHEIRFIAVSSTIPNIEDIAEWLGTDDHAAVHFKIDEEYRPVKLKKVVLGYPCKSGDGSFKFDLSLNYKLQSIIMKHAEGKPTLIFCSTRKGVEMTAAYITKAITFHISPEQKHRLQQAAQTMLDSKMKIQLSNGVGCHHGGMTPDNRLTIENVFRDGILPVLITTSTLAMGVNLPAHLVIIKSTEYYTQGGFQDYSESSLMQMIGRAGRPQFDTSATVVIMTKLWQKEKYERMLGGTELIESNLHRHLTEHLNAEVVLGIISDIAVALDWIRHTFLYIRVQKNPKHYNIPMNLTKAQIEKKLQDLCQIEINALNRYGMLQIDQTDGFSLYTTNIGKIMANYYLAFNTMKLFVEIKGNESLIDILNIISKSFEFSETYLRVNDKKTLNTLNRCKYQDTIRFPLPGNIKTSVMKVNCIIQATFGCLRIQDPSLLQESQKIMKIGERLSNCLVEYILNKNNCFTALLNALILKQCFYAKIWENSAHVSRQLHKIGTVLSSMLVAAGKTTFKSILESNPRDIEMIINRGAPMGNQIQEEILHLPFYRIKIEPPENNNDFKVKIIVTLLNPENILPSCTAGLQSCMTLIAGDTDNHLLCCEKLYHNTMAVCKEHIQYVDVVSKVDHEIRAYFISENWVGLDCQDKVDIIMNSSANSNLTSKEKTIINTPKPNQNKKTLNTPIANYLKKIKKQPIKNIEKKSRPKKSMDVTKIGTKPIDSYFSKNKVNNNLKLMSPPVAATNYDFTKQNNDNVFKKIQNLPENNLMYNENSTNVSLTKSEANNKNKLNLDSKILKKGNSFDKFKQNLKYYQNNSDLSVLTSYNKEILNQNINNKYNENDYIFQNDIEELRLGNNYNKPTEVYKNNANFLNSASCSQMSEATLNFKDFSFFVSDSKKNDNNFYPSNICDIFESQTQSQNYSQFSFINNNKSYQNNILNQNDEEEEIYFDINVMDTLSLGNKTNIESYNQNKFQDSQNITQTLPTRPKSCASNSEKLKVPKLNKYKYSDKIISPISYKNYTESSNKSVRKKPSEAFEILSQFNYTPKKKFQHNTQKKQVEENIFELEVISNIDDEFDNYDAESNNINKDILKNASQHQNTKKENVNDEESRNYMKQKDEIDNKLDSSNANESQSIHLKYLSEIQNKLPTFTNNNEAISTKLTQDYLLTNKKSEEETQVEKPPFPKTFREYVQQSIKKLKSETLVNEYYNYDIGFEEFLMAPLNDNYGNSEGEDDAKEDPQVSNLPAINTIQQNTTSINITNNTKIEDKYNGTFNLTSFIEKNTNNSPKEPFVDNSINDAQSNTSFTMKQTSESSFDFDNITFLSNAVESLNESNSTLNKSNNCCSEVNYENDNLDIFPVSSHNLETSNMDLHIENKSKIIEQWIDSQVSNTQSEMDQKFELRTQDTCDESLPYKKFRLSAPLAYSKYSKKSEDNEENKKISDKIYRNNIFEIKNDVVKLNNENKPLERRNILSPISSYKPVSMNSCESYPENEISNKRKSNDFTLVKQSSFSSYCVDKTKYQVVIFEKQESYITQN